MRRTWRGQTLALSGAVLAVLGGLPLFYLLAHALQQPQVVWDVLSRSSTYAALARSLGLALAVGASCVVLSLPLAWLTHATDLPARRAFRALLMLPLAIPSYVGGFVVIAAFAPGGFAPVFDPYGALGAVLALSFTYPLALLPIAAALERIDARQWECARSLGCTPRQAFVRVVLPQLRPSLAIGGLLVGLYALGDFGAVSLTRFPSLSYLVYLRHKSLFDRHEAVPLSLLLIALSALLALGLLALGGRAHRELRAERRVWPVVPLGRYRNACALACALVVAAFVVLPLAVVCGWLARGHALGNPAPWPLRQAGQSLFLGLSAALLLVALGFVPVLLARFAGRAGARALQALSYLGYALPGIVVALALVSLATGPHVPTIFYQSWPLLFFAYAIRFLPLAAGTLDDALSAQSPQLFWAARSLGAPPLFAFTRVMLPALRPALAAAALSVFIAVVKELPVTLLVSPIGLSTLATHIWSLTEEAYFAAAAPAVLLLVLFAVLGLLLRPDIRRRQELP